MSITPRAHETEEEFYRRIYGNPPSEQVAVILPVEDLQQVEPVCSESEVEVDGPATLEDLELGYVRLEIYLAVKLRNRSWRLRSRLDLTQVPIHPAQQTPCARFAVRNTLRTV